ncbi:6-bladed beta-propeller [Algoriphagus algorifonticola]|uniref:6-bladed beta-propeller n=1 Tax=Algoriphagus algorifonticola TaxID=2593007 RepID=UPI00119DE369|nr:6-bladed beta-propeller [Algoriphagus algorifonticola]
MENIMISRCKKSSLNLEMISNFLQRYCKNILSIIVTFGLLILIFGCSKEDSKNQVEVINIPQRNDRVKIQEISSKITSIQLETSSDSYLGRIDEVKIINDHLFILDDLKKISIFDLDGKFKSRLAPIGDGPGELGVIYSICEDRDSGKIYVSTGYRLLEFSSEFKFIKETKFSGGIYHLFFDKNQLYAITDDFLRQVDKKFQTETFILKIDENLEIVDSISFRKVVLDSKIISGYRYKNWISRDKSGLYFYKPVLTPDLLVRDTLYEKIGDNFSPILKFNFNHNVSIDNNGIKSLNIYNIIKSNEHIIIEFQDELRRVAYINLNNGLSKNIPGGFSFSGNDDIVIRPLDLENELFYFIHYDKYSDSQTQEMNPVVNIVKLK